MYSKHIPFYMGYAVQRKNYLYRLRREY